MHSFGSRNGFIDASKILGSLLLPDGLLSRAKCCYYPPEWSNMPLKRSEIFEQPESIEFQQHQESS
jgi:hypothetical protein